MASQFYNKPVQNSGERRRREFSPVIDKSRRAYIIKPEPMLRDFVEIEVNIQIYGTVKCQDTKKAQRYFKERHIQFQFIDLTRKGLSKGELSSIKAAVGIENLMDREGKTYAEKNLKYLIHDIEEELLKDSLLLKTPIVRNGREATTGYKPDTWKEWK